MSATLDWVKCKLKTIFPEIKSSYTKPVLIQASGKTTMAELVQNHFKSKNIPVMILDGDEIRKTLSKDLPGMVRLVVLW